MIKNAKTVRVILAGILTALMVLQPVLGLVGGAITVDSGGYNVGEATGELYPFINLETGKTAAVVESGPVSESRNLVNLTTSTDHMPVGVMAPAAQSQNSLRGAPASGSIAPAGYELDTVTGGAPAGAMLAEPQVVDGTASSIPTGAIGTTPRSFTAPTSLATGPQGAAAVSAQNDNSYRAGTEGWGAVGGGNPAGMPNNNVRNSGAANYGAIPNGAMASWANTRGGAWMTTNQNGAANINTRTINAASGSLAIDIDGNGATNVVNFQLNDVNVDGDYNDNGDTMYISANDGDWFDGNVNDGQVFTAGAGSDESVNGWGAYVYFDNNNPANRYEFWMDFGGTPAAPSVWITAQRWGYSGQGNPNPLTVSIDNDWGTEGLYYSLTDSNSDGIYDTADLSTDNWWGTGVLNDGIVDANNDERLTANGNIQLGTAGNRYTYSFTFTTDPAETDPDITITSLDWFQGAMVIDTDADGSADDSVNFALGDLNSNGLYDTLELSTDDAVFGEIAVGALNDDMTGANNDELDQGEDYCLFDTYTFFHTYTGGAGEWTDGFDETPDGAGDFNIRSTIWYRGDWLIDTDMDGLADDTVYYVLSDSNSDGLYEQMDVSLDNTFLQGAANDGAVANNNDETETNLAFNNLVYTSNENVRIVNNDFRISFVNNPANANQANDGRLTANYYSGTLTVDVDGNGGANDVVNFTLSDKESDGMTETVEWTTDDGTYGEGAGTDNATTDANDETDVGSNGAGVLSWTEQVRLGKYLFNALHTYYPGPVANDVTITALEWFTGNFSVDVDGTGIARNVAFSIADSNSDGLYETVDLSSDDTLFAEDPAFLANGAIEKIGTGHDDERFTVDQTILFRNYNFFVDFDNNPGYDNDDIRITAQEWFTGFWSVDVDGDGTLDHVNAVLDDTNSNGLYDTLELSMGDWTFGEGHNGNGRLMWNDDELVTAPAKLFLGLHSFNVTFDNNPAGDASDTVILAQEGYSGHFTIDANADGMANEDIQFSLADEDSDGLFEALELSLGDKAFGEGVLNDGIVAAGNDELLPTSGDASVGGLLFSFTGDDSPSSGTSDGVLEAMTVWTGSVLLEGVARNAAASDGNSDGIYDALYIDLDGDNAYADGGILRAGSVLETGLLALSYRISGLDHTGASATLAPAGSLPSQATAWMVGSIPAGGVPCTVAISDRNGDNIADYADFDTDGDGVLDDRGNTEGSLSTVTLGANGYQVMNIADDASSVRLVAYTRAAMGPANDISIGGTFRTGTLSEEGTGTDFNGDGDSSDFLEVVLVDSEAPGVFNGMYLDTDGDSSLVAEQALAADGEVTIGAASFVVDRLSQDGSGASMRQTNMPSATGKSAADGSMALDAPSDGLYWLKVSGGALWGFRTYNGTNGGYGYHMMAGAVTLPTTLFKGGFAVAGKITDAASGTALSGVLVGLYSKTGSLVMSSMSRADGTYRVAGAPDSGYSLVFTLVGYITDDGRSGGTLGSMSFSSDATDKNIALKKDTQAPSLTMKKPVDGQILAGDVPVEVDASDNFMLAAVEVSTDMGVTWTVMKGVGTNYTYLWATQAGQDGEYRVTVRARDPGGLATYQHRTVYIGNEKIPPTLRVAQPMDGRTYAGVLTIAAQASDTGGIRKVAASIADSTGKVVKEVPLWTEGTPGTYAGFLDTLKLVDGSYTVTVTVWDRAMNNASGTVAIKVDNTAPQLSKFNAGDKEKVRIQAVFTEATSIRTVLLRIDGGAWKEMSSKDGLTYTYEWQTKEGDNGAHNVELRATDSVGNEARYTKQVQINNTPWSLIIAVMILVLIVVAAAVMAFGGRKKKAEDLAPPEPEQPVQAQTHTPIHHGHKSKEPAPEPDEEPAEPPKTESTDELEKIVSDLK